MLDQICIASSWHDFTIIKSNVILKEQVDHSKDPWCGRRRVARSTGRHYPLPETSPQLRMGIAKGISEHYSILIL
jgi:hypothetical protein